MPTRETILKMTKRSFLIGSAALAGGLVVGYAVLREKPGTAGFEDWGKKGAALNAWVKITPDGDIIIAVPRAEMGQGVYTSVAMLIAEELEVDLDQVTVEHPDRDGKYINKFSVRSQMGSDFPPLIWVVERMTARIPMVGTGASSTIRGAWTTMPVVGAAAREMLIAAAAARWGVAPDQCEARSGRITNRKTQVSLGYGELAEAAALLEVPANPPLKDPSEYRLVGTPVQRLDIPDKVTGSAVFSIDVSLPDMLYAVMRPCPFCDGRVSSYEPDAVKNMPGVIDVIEIQNGVAVVADSYWHARKAADALDIDFAEPEGARVNSSMISQDYIRVLEQPDEVFTVRDDGDAAAALAGAARSVEAIYQVPFLAHACMEPLNCTVRVDGDRAEVWVGSQSPTMAALGVARGAGIEPENVTCHITYMGGGFGRRADLDWIVQAAQIARAMEGRPVKLIWSREDDMVQDTFRPAAVARFKGGLDDNGAPVAWSNRIVVQPLIVSFIERAMLDFPVTPEKDRTMTEGAIELPYGIDNLLVDKVSMRLPVEVGNWRSVGHSFNAFFTESFVDEMAHAARRDAYEFRRALLAESPRHLAVLDLAAKKSGWGEPRGARHGRGLALHESFGTIVAEVVDVFVSHDGKVRVDRVVCVVDCGSVVNPDTVAAQMESGIVFGLSAALYGEITIEDSRVVQQNFPAYDVVRLHDMPIIEAHIMPGSEFPGGVGEPSTPPIAAAVANAVFDASGVRVRRLPLTRANFRSANKNNPPTGY